MSSRLRIGVALDGAGWHPAAWREPSSRPAELFSPDYWVDLVRIAEEGLLDFATIEDSLALQSSERSGPDDRTDEVRGRLDALLIAARVSPATSHIGLIPTVTTTHTEPFHVSKAVATLDYTSEGRAGWQVKVSGRADEAAHFGRREHPGTEVSWGDPAFDVLVAELFDEAADAVEVVRRLWDSWEDDAEIRDVATDRFLDADKVHEIDFEGRWFSVRGPSITPRPPQGQPVVAALAHAEVPYRLAARAADVVFVTPTDAAHARAILDDVGAAATAVSREGSPLQVFADIVVFLDERDGESAADRLRRLDAVGRPLTSDARIFTGSASELADVIAEFGALGYDGVRLRPGVLTDDLPRIAGDLGAELRARGLFHDAYEADTLRGLLGLPENIPSRYAAV
ncbi:alkanesulfonate monooxygenase SsuD/methylene tetrahydromethanopterin reductase-like flavin-dependent oxidoreductase (luciferase family) [Microbacterium natoriense]|uniref:Alkanesulfonate monooxygenase SsuD/methylene tetrahydromethanopterin reductase-like flavin-dependent oxidoreductase (Luciferase family) n=1 Tax=Microbacterium natoriense TaxID=284570 RepID=A0AAW8F0Q0_9MICO|nr:LLM class flavin-dependent oxidoreductase [Microbacterium natoriense]MDQ0649365.1 alkanesulfonate monooxygenase SsuD/methylene tetrahydromethanopterin reductase-like flavin-dependent oxidoreductase (luciferase family) [Microbacterium natoriense]